MSAAESNVVPLRRGRRAAQAQPVHKLQVLEQVRRLILEDHPRDSKTQTKLTSAAMAVVQYLAEITDKDTGAAIVGVRTIARRIGRDQKTVRRQLKRLAELGVVTKQARGKASWSFVNAYRLINPADRKSQTAEPAGSPATLPPPTSDPTPSHQRPPYAREESVEVFPHGSNHHGEGGSKGGYHAQSGTEVPAISSKTAQQNAASRSARAVTWTHWAWRLAPLLRRHYAQYHVHRDSDVRRELELDLATWAKWVGPSALVASLDRAMVANDGRPLFEQRLYDYIRNTKPEPGYPGWRRSRVDGSGTPGARTTESGTKHWWSSKLPSPSDAWSPRQSW